jgi:hypothetical protein
MMLSPLGAYATTFSAELGLCFVILTSMYWYKSTMGFAVVLGWTEGVVK